MSFYEVQSRIGLYPYNRSNLRLNFQFQFRGLTGNFWIPFHSRVLSRALTCTPGRLDSRKAIGAQPTGCFEFWALLPTCQTSSPHGMLPVQRRLLLFIIKDRFFILQKSNDTGHVLLTFQKGGLLLSLFLENCNLRLLRPTRPTEKGCLLWSTNKTPYVHDQSTNEDV